jgi:hypothetical protein
MSIFTAIEGVFKKGEADFTLIVGDVKKFFVAHPALENDMKLLFGPAVDIIVGEGKSIEASVMSGAASGATVGSVISKVIDGIGNTIPKAVASIVDQADNSANAFQIASTAASYIVGQISAQVTPAQAAQPVAAGTASVVAVPPTPAA